MRAELGTIALTSSRHLSTLPHGPCERGTWVTNRGLLVISCDIIVLGWEGRI